MAANPEEALVRGSDLLKPISLEHGFIFDRLDKGD